MQECMLKDIQYAFRSLGRNPGFTLTAILSIALAIGANSTIFSYADGLLLRPLPVPDPSRIVILRAVPPSVSFSVLNGTGQSRMSYADFEDFRRNTKSFEGLAAFDQVIVSFARDAKSKVESRLGCQVSADFFRTLHVEPQLGRGFRPEEDDAPGREAVVVLSHNFWTNEFGGDPNVIGREIRLNNQSFTVIGVAPESFSGVDPFTQQDLYVLVTGPKLYSGFENLQTDRHLRWFVVYGRLKSAVSMRSAAEEVSALAKSLEASFPATNRGFGATVSTEREFRLISLPVIGGLVSALFTLTVIILLIACANVANLTLGRGRERAREIGVRLAIGGSRSRLLRLLLIESVLIAAGGGTLAMLAARWSLRIVSSLEIPSDLPFRLIFQVDQRVLWFTLVVSALSVLLFGLLPAIQSTRADLVTIIKAAGSDTMRKRLSGSYALVIIQIAGTMVLLVLTAQGRRNFENLLASNPGFRKDHRLTMRFNPEASGYSPERTRQFYERLVERAAEVTGVQSAALASGLPLTYDPSRIQVVPEGYEFAPGRESVSVLTYIVDHHYFDTFGVPILSGRSFQPSDRRDTAPVAIVNETFAQEYLGANPIGKRVRVKRLDSNARLDEFTVEVVGVSMTGKTFLLTEPPAQVVYLPLSQNFHDRMTLIAATTGDPLALSGPLQAAVQSIDPNMPVFRVRTMEDIFEHSSVALLRAVSEIYNLAAAMGLSMALIGLYAVVSYRVARRTREIGIRMAVGAKRSQVVQMFLNHALGLSLAGVSIGLLMSVFANRLSESALGIGSPDPWVWTSVSLALLLTSLAAAAIPARRAARIDPQQALRED
jgi:macrolide transport system ATP-binding/permease protein